MTDACVLVSGGIDSMTMLWEATHRYSDVYPVYIRSGLYWEDTELDYIERYLDELHREVGDVIVLDAPMDDLFIGHWSVSGDEIPDSESDDEEVYIPGRNIMLLSKAGIYSSENDIEEILHGTLHDNPFPDSTRDFFDTFEVMLSIGLDYEISIETPYSGYDKDEVLERAIDNDLPLIHTFSCINPVDGVHCGGCNKCRERQEGFKNTGNKDPVQYRVNKS